MKSVNGRIEHGLCVFIVFVAIAISFGRANSVSQDSSLVAGSWQVGYEFETEEYARKFVVGSKSVKTVTVKITNVDINAAEANGLTDFYFKIQIENEKLAYVDKVIEKSELQTDETNANLTKWYGTVEVYGRFFGFTRMFVTLNKRSPQEVIETSDQTVIVTVVRDERINDKIFSYTAGALILLMFMNLGTVLDLERFKMILMKPIGPFIGFLGRYAFMPAIGFGLGNLFFPEDKNLQLALFFTALSPSGGLANICIVFLKGNINLSIASTTINSLMALAMLPLWIFVLARPFYNESTLSVPFVDLAVSSVALILAIGTGIGLRYFLPKTTKLLFRFLKPLSVTLSLGLVALTVGINFFVFSELDGMIFLAVLILPLMGYLSTFTLSKICKRTPTDALTIGIETGVLNMTVPIVLLQFSLGEPRADMAVVVPILASLASLCFVLIFYVVRRFFGWNKTLDDEAFDAKRLRKQSMTENMEKIYF